MPAIAVAPAEDGGHDKDNNNNNTTTMDERHSGRSPSTSAHQRIVSPRFAESFRPLAASDHQNSDTRKAPKSPTNSNGPTRTATAWMNSTRRILEHALASHHSRLEETSTVTEEKHSDTALVASSSLLLRITTLRGRHILMSITVSAREGKSNQSKVLPRCCLGNRIATRLCDATTTTRTTTTWMESSINFLFQSSLDRIGSSYVCLT